MPFQKIIPNLWFNNQAKEAAEFYVSLFKNSKMGNITWYNEDSSKVSGMPEGSIMTVEFELAGKRFVGLNGGPVFSFTPAISFFVQCETTAEVNHLFESLAEGGEVLMPLDRYSFSQRYAWINDCYGVSWQLSFGGQKQTINPSLLFVQNQYGKAEEAVRFYTSVFENSKIENMIHYQKGEGDKETAIKYASFTINGEQFITMDSGLEHKFNFTPAISFMVECKDQNEIDHFWNNLSAVPEAEQCGWIQDKYGVSWQIVPSILDKLITDADQKKARRVTKAMLQMKKLDIKALVQAYEQD